MMPEFIKENLEKHHIEFESWNHEPIRTCEEAAETRKTNLSKGTKAMILFSKKQNKGFALFVPCGRKIDMKKLRKLTEIKDLKLATPDKAFELSGLKVGGISPLGFKTKLNIWIDRHVFDNEYIYCSATSETSVKLKSKDLLVLHDAVVEEFTQLK